MKIKLDWRHLIEPQSILFLLLYDMCVFSIWGQGLLAPELLLSYWTLTIFTREGFL